MEKKHDCNYRKNKAIKNIIYYNSHVFCERNETKNQQKISKQNKFQRKFKAPKTKMFLNFEI